MSVIGIDFGCYSSSLSIIQNGAAKTIPVDCGLLSMPSYVAFTNKRRLVGVEAKNQAVVDPSNTIFGFKRYLGRQYDDAIVVEDRTLVPFAIMKRKDNGITFRIRYLGQNMYLTTEQITGIFLRKLKETAENYIRTTKGAELPRVENYVMSVPFYYTDAQTRALLDAAHIAGFNLSRLKLIYEPLAASFNYAALHQPYLPEPTAPPRNVVIIDCGWSLLEVAIFAFNKGKQELITSQFVVELGGKTFDTIFAQHFLGKFGLNPMKDPKTYLHLLPVVEDLKRWMSYWEDDEHQLKLKFLMNNKYFVDSMNRATFEEVVKRQNTFDVVRQVIQMALNKTKLRLCDIHSVELIGGSTKIPGFQNLIQEIFDKAPGTSMDKDLAISHGCAWAGTVFLPELRLSKYKIGGSPFPFIIKVEWIMEKEENRNPTTQVSPILPQSSLPVQDRTIFFSGKTVTFRIMYISDVGYATKVIGEYIVDLEGCDPNSQKLQFDVNVNGHGVVCFMGATLVEEIRTVEKVNVEGEHKQAKRQRMDNGESSASNSNHLQQGAAANGVVEVETIEYKKIKDLPVKRQVFEFSPALVEKMRGDEASMAFSDKVEERRIWCRNRLDDYVQKCRTEMLDMVQYGGLKYRDVEVFVERLHTVGSQIYRENKNKSKEVYERLLQELQDRRKRIPKPKARDEAGSSKRKSSPPPLIQLN
ncbi:unnamed protein product [Orchesella dallaii]|uniref:Heat shock 70 kDa protein n=1 Tax=Orchesella dallaii TaxID=48710 RepID=A0ABP1RIZ0_9HEXA